LPKEFALYTDHQALKFINFQPKLSQRHTRWVEFLQECTFALQHKARKSNCIANALSTRIVSLSTNSIEVVGFARLKDNSEFGKAWQVVRFLGFFKSIYTMFGGAS
jgi:hypothetical protein